MYRSLVPGVDHYRTLHYQNPSFMVCYYSQTNLCEKVQNNTHQCSWKDVFHHSIGRTSNGFSFCLLGPVEPKNLKCMVFIRSDWCAKLFLALSATFAQLYDQSSYLYLLGRSDRRSVLTGRSKRSMQMRSWQHWLEWIIKDLIPSGCLHENDVHSNSTLVVTPEGPGSSWHFSIAVCL